MIETGVRLSAQPPRLTDAKLRKERLMPKLVKITTFMDDRVGREQAEKELSYLVNEGWDIVTAGGGGHQGTPVWGFVVLVKDDPDAPVPTRDDEDIPITY